MVRTGQAGIRQVRFLPPAPSVRDIEVNTVKGIRDRGGPTEFLTPQRLDFDLLMRLTRGAAGHTVDFTDHALGPGDVMWIRAGQVHQWGAIDDLEGTVVMFGPASVDERTRELIRSHTLSPRNRWPAAAVANTPITPALDLLVSTARADPLVRPDLRQAALAHALAALLIELERADDTTAPSSQRATEAFVWFRDHIEQHFRTWHKVGEYADRIGYSTRTLNRLARQHTGRSAKELIDERVVLEAKRQLSHGEATVAEIADLLGFDDASNFSSYFRKQSGMTPGAFRRWARGEGAGRSAPVSR